MNNRIIPYEKINGRLFAIVCAALILSGCQTVSVDPRGRVVQEEKRITLPESGERNGVYQTDDLTLRYKMARAPGLLTISGEIHFANRVAENFPVIRYFHLDAVLIDSQGRVQNMAGLISASFYHSEYITPSDPPLTFSTPLTVGQETKSVAFSYTGKAIDPTEHQREGMSFWEYPLK